MSHPASPGPPILWIIFCDTGKAHGSAYLDEKEVRAICASLDGGCPSCHGRHTLVAYERAPSPAEQATDRRARAWMGSHDVGVSSATIWHVLTGTAARCTPVLHGDPSPPIDPYDFGRCHRLLERIPEWRERLPEVALFYPEWSALIREWDALAAAWERVDGEREGTDERRAAWRAMYDRMQELLREGWAVRRQRTRPEGRP